MPTSISQPETLIEVANFTLRSLTTLWTMSNLQSCFSIILRPSRPGSAWDDRHCASYVSRQQLQFSKTKEVGLTCANVTKYHHSSYRPWNGCVCFTLLSVKFQTVFVTKNQIFSFMQIQKHVPIVKIDAVPFCLVVGRDKHVSALVNIDWEKDSVDAFMIAVLPPVMDHPIKLFCRDQREYAIMKYINEQAVVYEETDTNRDGISC